MSNELLHKLISGAISGLLAAVVVDVNAWAKAGPGAKFDWGLAVTRWISGAVTGALAALGIAQQ